MSSESLPAAHYLMAVLTVVAYALLNEVFKNPVTTTLVALGVGVVAIIVARFFRHWAVLAIVLGSLFVGLQVIPAALFPDHLLIAMVVWNLLLFAALMIINREMQKRRPPQTR